MVIFAVVKSSDKQRVDNQWQDIEVTKGRNCFANNKQYLSNIKETNMHPNGHMGHKFAN